VTERLRPGANAVGVMLGEGWFKSRALRMQIHVELAFRPARRRGADTGLESVAGSSAGIRTRDLEGRRVSRRNTGIAGAKAQDGVITIAVGSGDYAFELLSLQSE
jgi:hypothetical protein